MLENVLIKFLYLILCKGSMYFCRRAWWWFQWNRSMSP